MIGRWVFHLLRRHWSTYPFLCVYIPSSNWYAPTLPLLLLFVYASHLMQTLLVPSWINQKKKKKYPSKLTRKKHNNWTVTHLNKQWGNHHYSMKLKNIYIWYSAINTVFTHYIWPDAHRVSSSDWVIIRKVETTPTAAHIHRITILEK
jgi:hypothetical protein